MEHYFVDLVLTCHFHGCFWIKLACEFCLFSISLSCQNSYDYVVSTSPSAPPPPLQDAHWKLANTQTRDDVWAHKQAGERHMLGDNFMSVFKRCCRASMTQRCRLSLETTFSTSASCTIILFPYIINFPLCFVTASKGHRWHLKACVVHDFQTSIYNWLFQETNCIR